MDKYNVVPINFKVAAADKQLRAARLFLEEQASDREIEREEYIKEIQKLNTTIKEKERDEGNEIRLARDVSYSTMKKCNN